MTDLPRCKLCGGKPVPYQNFQGFKYTCHVKNCTLCRVLMTEEQWRNLMGEAAPKQGEPVCCLDIDGDSFTLSIENNDAVVDLPDGKHYFYAAQPAPEPGWIKCCDKLPPLGHPIDLYSNGTVQNEVYWLDQGDDGIGAGEYYWDCNNPDLDECPSVNFDRDMWRERPAPPEKADD